MVQNLADPDAQQVVDGARLVERSLPAEVDASRILPALLSPHDTGQTCGVVLPDVDIDVTFAVSSSRPTAGTAGPCLCAIAFAADLPRELLDDATAGYYSSTEQPFGLVSPTAAQLVPGPGVDPRLLGPTAFSRSIGPDAGGADGIVGVIAAQPWAEVLAGPEDVVIVGHPGWLIDVLLRPGTGSVPCGDQALTVVTGLDEPGRTFLDTLRLVDLAS